MSIISNSVNYATPSYGSIAEESFTDSAKYFSLHDNVLDGTYKTIGAVAPLWSNVLSDATGAFATPAEISIENILSPNILDFVAWSSSLTATRGTISNITDYSFTLTATSDDAHTNTYNTHGMWIPVLPNTVYCISYDKDKEVDTEVYVFYYTGDTDTSFDGLGNGYGTRLIFVTPDYCTHVKIRLDVNTMGNIVTFSNIQITKLEPFTAHALHLKGDAASNCYPTNFTYTLYSGDTVLFSQTFVNNAVDWTYPLPQAYEITRYSVSIAAINKANYTLRLTNAFNTHLIGRSSSLSVNTTQDGFTWLQLTKALSASLSVGVNQAKAITNKVGAVDRLWTPIGLSAAGGVDTLITSADIGKDLIVRGPATKVGFGLSRRNIFNVRALSSVSNVNSSSFDASIWAATVLDNTWVIAHIKKNTMYTMSYDVTLLSKSSLTIWQQVYADFRLYTKVSGASIDMGGLTYAQYAAMNVGDTIHVEKSFTTPADLFSFVVLGYSARHTSGATVELSSMRFSNVKLEQSDSASLWIPATEEAINIAGSFQYATLPTLNSENDFFNLTTGETYINGVSSFNTPISPTLFDGSAYMFSDGGGETRLLDDSTPKDISVTAKNSFAAALDLNHTDTIKNSFKRSMNAAINQAMSSAINNRFSNSDSLKANIVGSTHPINIMTPSDDIVVDTPMEDILTNIHSVMKDPNRQVFGKLSITYSSPLIDDNVTVTPSGFSNVSNLSQLSDTVIDDTEKRFFLFDNVLDGTYMTIGNNSEMGWWSDTLSNADGTFTVPPSVTLTAAARLITELRVISSKVNNIILVDFSVEVISNGTMQTFNIVGNTNYYVVITDVPLAEVTSIKVIVSKINRSGVPANITEIPIASVMWYDEQVISIDMLEELSYDDEVEALGGVSANELTAVLDNTDKQFFFNSGSLVAKQLKKNRKVVAYLGAEVVPGEVEWHCLGTYWSYSWEVPANQLYARVVAFDTIGLLNTLEFKNHRVFIDQSVGQLIDAILDDAKLQYPQLNWLVDASLYNIVIPYAWFDKDSYMQALKRVAACERINIYANRDGTIMACSRYRDRALLDTWSDATNIIDKMYPTLYTNVPNTINVAVNEISIAPMDTVVSTESFNIAIISSKILTASAPLVQAPTLTIDADTTVNYTYSWYSWGIVFNFTGSGVVRSITATANCITTKQTSVVTRANQQLVSLDGTIPLNIESAFIQTYQHAVTLADTILADADLDIYDADIEYTGDISLSVNDAITLQDSIAPTSRYFIKRHELSWDGALTGKAKVNT